MVETFIDEIGDGLSLLVRNITKLVMDSAVKVHAGAKRRWRLHLGGGFWLSCEFNFFGYRFRFGRRRGRRNCRFADHQGIEIEYRRSFGHAATSARRPLVWRSIHSHSRRISD